MSFSFLTSLIYIQYTIIHTVSIADTSKTFEKIGWTKDVGWNKKNNKRINDYIHFCKLIE